jgi:hypothetical protein
MVTDEPRFPVKVTVRAARADGNVEAARRREAVAEGSFMVMCGDAAQAATQHSMRSGDVKCGHSGGNAAKWSNEGAGGGSAELWRARCRDSGAVDAKRGFRFRKPREVRFLNRLFWTVQGITRRRRRTKRPQARPTGRAVWDGSGVCSRKEVPVKLKLF